MNIFVTDPNPEISAKNLDDKRVIKMILESAQLLMTALNTQGIETPYKNTHINHPCSIWCRTTKQNFKWLLNHYEALCKEYTNRFNKTHKCYQYLDFFTQNLDKIPDGNLTNHPNCTIFKEEKDTYLAYRKALLNKWDNDKITPRWTKANRPDWNVL